MLEDPEMYLSKYTEPIYFQLCLCCLCIQWKWWHCILVIWFGWTSVLKKIIQNQFLCSHENVRATLSLLPCFLIFLRIKHYLYYPHFFPGLSAWSSRQSHLSTHRLSTATLKTYLQWDLSSKTAPLWTLFFTTQVSLYFENALTHSDPICMGMFLGNMQKFFV